MFYEERTRAFPGKTDISCALDLNCCSDSGVRAYLLSEAAVFWKESRECFRDKGLTGQKFMSRGEVLMWDFPPLCCEYVFQKMDGPLEFLLHRRKLPDIL